MFVCLLDEAFAYREVKTQSFDDFLAQRIDQLSVDRCNLLNFLKTSQLYNAGALLARFSDTGLHAELAIVYFRVRNFLIPFFVGVVFSFFSLL